MVSLLCDGQEARVRVNGVFRSNAPLALRDLATQGAGVALLPAWFVAGALERRELRRLLPRWRTEPVTVHAIHRTEHRGALRVRTLVDHLRAAYARL